MTTVAATRARQFPTERAEPLQILIIEDNPVDATMARALLADELGDAHRCAWVRDLTAGREALAASTPSCILLDLGLPESDGLATLDEVMALAPDTAIVVLTGLDDDQSGRAAVVRGAEDYLVKGKTDSGLLVRAIRYAVDRKQAETARRQGEDRLRLAISSMVDPVFVTRSIRAPAGGIVGFSLEFANSPGLRLLGLSADQVIGRMALEDASALPAELLAAGRRVVETGEPFNRRLRVEGARAECGDAPSWIDVSIVPFGDGYLMSARDVTARESAERALHESEERFRGLIENSTDITLVLDADGNLLYFSPAGQSVLGYEPEAMVGTAALDLVHPDDLADASAALAAAAADRVVRSSVTFRIRHASGAWRWFEATANNRLAEPSIRGVVVNARDVTDLMRTTLALKDLNRVLRTLTAADTAVVHATDERTLLDAMCQLIVETGGYPRACIAQPDPTHPNGMVPVASHGGDDRFFEDVIESSWGAPTGPLAQAARHARTCVVQDISGLAKDLPVRRIALDHGYRSMIAMPLRADEGVLGALAISASEVDAFDAEEVALLERLAGNLAYGVSSLRARAERDRYFEQLERNVGAMVETIVTTVEYRDPYTAGHQRRVAQLAAVIAHELTLDSDTIAGIELAANVHDIGKIAVPAEILSKPGRLTGPEFELVKQHARAGFEILKGIDFRWPVPEMILQHHERLDGSGYPSGLAGDAILLGARIIAVADTVEATSSHRPYRASRGVAAALEAIGGQRGRAFDADVVDACIRAFREGAFRFEANHGSPSNAT